MVKLRLILKIRRQASPRQLSALVTMSKTWACLLSLLVVAVAGSSTTPTVQLGNATVIGINDGRNNQFLGIPYAQPPYVYF